MAVASLALPAFACISWFETDPRRLEVASGMQPWLTTAKSVVGRRSFVIGPRFWNLSIRPSCLETLDRMDVQWWQDRTANGLFSLFVSFVLFPAPVLCFLYPFHRYPHFSIFFYFFFWRLEDTPCFSAEVILTEDGSWDLPLLLFARDILAPHMNEDWNWDHRPSLSITDSHPARCLLLAQILPRAPLYDSLHVKQ